jgi:hypothetical protein
VSENRSSRNEKYYKPVFSSWLSLLLLLLLLLFCLVMNESIDGGNLGWFQVDVLHFQVFPHVNRIGGSTEGNYSLGLDEPEEDLLGGLPMLFGHP